MVARLEGEEIKASRLPESNLWAKSDFDRFEAELSLKLVFMLLSEAPAPIRPLPGSIAGHAASARRASTAIGSRLR